MCARISDLVFYAITFFKKKFHAQLKKMGRMCVWLCRYISTSKAPTPLPTNIPPLSSPPPAMCCPCQTIVCRYKPSQNHNWLVSFYHFTPFLRHPKQVLILFLGAAAVWYIATHASGSSQPAEPEHWKAAAGGTDNHLFLSNHRLILKLKVGIYSSLTSARVLFTAVTHVRQLAQHMCIHA